MEMEMGTAHEMLPVQEHSLGSEHETLPGTHKGATRQHLVCDADGGDCEVVSAIVPKLIEGTGSGQKTDEAIAAAKGDLPCHWCRRACRDASGLSGTRLGKQERRILANAAEVDAKWSEPVCAPTYSRSERVAANRAAAKLARIGLVTLFTQTIEINRRSRLAGKFAGWDLVGNTITRTFYRDDLTERADTHIIAAKLTPLGREIKERFSAELTQGKPIRWDGRVAEAAKAVRLGLADLLGHLRRDLQESYEIKTQIVSLVAAGQGNQEYIAKEAAVVTAMNRALKAIEATGLIPT